MKKIFAILLILTVILSLAACGSKTPEKESESVKETTGDGAENNGDVTDSAGIQTGLPGEDYDVGDYTVYAPGGWVPIPQQDPDEPGTVSTSIIRLVRGAEYDDELKVWKMSGLPYVEISRFGGEELDKVPGSKEEWDSTEDMEDVTIGSFTWQGFTYEYIGSDGAVVWSMNDETGYRVTVSYAKTLDIENADVQAIIESLK